MSEATTPPMSIEQARFVLGRSSLNKGANVLADVAAEHKRLIKKGLQLDKTLEGPRMSIVERAKLLAATPLLGITRMAAEAVAKRTGGRLEPYVIKEAQEVQRQSTPLDWNGGSTTEQPMHPEVAESIDASLQASPEAKKELLDLIDQKLIGRAPSKFRPHEIGGDFIVEETNTPLSLFRWDSQANNPSGFLAMVHLIEWADGKTGGPKHITNYHFRDAPDELSVEKLKQYSENIPEVLGITPQERLQQVTEHLAELDDSIKATHLEREAGLTTFTQQDAIELKNLLKSAVPRNGIF